MITTAYPCVAPTSAPTSFVQPFSQRLHAVPWSSIWLARLHPSCLGQQQQGLCPVPLASARDPGLRQWRYPQSALQAVQDHGGASCESQTSDCIFLPTQGRAVWPKNLEAAATHPNE